MKREQQKNYLYLNTPLMVWVVHKAHRFGIHNTQEPKIVHKVFVNKQQFIPHVLKMLMGSVNTLRDSCTKWLKDIGVLRTQ
jgi:hypothetical protein